MFYEHTLLNTNPNLSFYPSDIPGDQENFNCQPMMVVPVLILPLIQGEMAKVVVAMSVAEAVDNSATCRGVHLLHIGRRIDNAILSLLLPSISTVSPASQTT